MKNSCWLSSALKKGLLICVLIVMFCWKKEVGQKLALIVSCVNDDQRMNGNSLLF